MFFQRQQSHTGSDTDYDQYVYEEEPTPSSEDVKVTHVHFDDAAGEDDEDDEQYKKPKGSPRLSGLFGRYAGSQEGSQMLLGASNKKNSSSNFSRTTTPTSARSSGVLPISIPRASPTSSSASLRARASPRAAAAATGGGPSAAGTKGALLPGTLPRSSSSNAMNHSGSLTLRSSSHALDRSASTRRSLSKGHLQKLDHDEDPERWRQASLAAARGRLSKNGSKALMSMEMGCSSDDNDSGEWRHAESSDADGSGLWSWPFSICLPISRSFFSARRFVRANQMRVISSMIMVVILALCITLAIVHLPAHHHRTQKPSKPPVTTPSPPPLPPKAPAPSPVPPAVQPPPAPAPAPPVVQPQLPPPAPAPLPPAVPIDPPPKVVPAPAPVPPPPVAPLPPPQAPPASAPGPDVPGAAEGGKYRNLFAEMLKKSDGDVQKKLDAMWNLLFKGDPETEAIYFDAGTSPDGDKMGYVMNTESNIVTSEAISYGMMVAVQFDKKDYYDSLWTWSSTYMRHLNGPYRGFFAWKCSLEGEKLDDTPAPDGEEWYATSLIFANNRWGSKGRYNYEAEAMGLLKALADPSRGMFTPSAQVTLNPVQIDITNPSYHLPAFYEVWAKFLTDRKETATASFYLKAAEGSRAMLRKAANERTGFAADYTDYDGKGIKDALGHSNFQWDAWRVVANLAVDWAWWRKDSWQQQEATTLQRFIYSEGIQNYPSTFSLDGQPMTENHAAGLVAVNAVASLAATNTSVATAFVTELWDAEVPTNKWRYYNGILLFLSLLQTSGRYRCLY